MLSVLTSAEFLFNLLIQPGVPLLENGLLVRGKNLILFTGKLMWELWRDKWNKQTNKKLHTDRNYTDFATHLKVHKYSIYWCVQSDVSNRKKVK